MHHSSSFTPHDAVFRKLLSHTGTARDFIEIHLPVALRSLCDLSTLSLESGSFVEESLRHSCTDILWSVKTREGEGYIYVLIEHQSSPDRHMAFRLMRYAIAAMQRHLEKGHHLLPLVIPLLFYHGRRSPYPWSMRWLDGFSLPEKAKALYSGPFPLVDITRIPDEEILQHRRIAMLEMVQKHVRQRDLMELQAHLATLLSLRYTSDVQLKALLTYLLQVGNTASPAAFLEGLADRTVDHEHRETLMNIAQHLREEGLSQGRREGIEQEAMRIARKLLENGLDPEKVVKLTGLSPELVEQARH